MKKISCLVLFSGGLDSLLAAKLLMAQEIEVVGICFKSNFFNCDKARSGARSLGIKLIEADITAGMISLVKTPPSGFGKHLNPCIDCHALMIKEASDYLRKNSLGKLFNRGFDFIATGEVLGQRPFSQNKRALARVQRLAGLEVLRPLSARLLPETEAERCGLVSREKLLDIAGRGRERQISLAMKLGISGYPAPAGGCLLTDADFCSRLTGLADNWPSYQAKDIELLKYGRIYWVALKERKNKLTKQSENAKMPKKALIVVGRNDNDNNNLERLAQKGDFMLKLREVTGPLALVRIPGNKTENPGQDLEIEVPDELKPVGIDFSEPRNLNGILGLAGLLTGFYSTKSRGGKVKIEIKIIK